MAQTRHRAGSAGGDGVHDRDWRAVSRQGVAGLFERPGGQGSTTGGGIHYDGNNDPAMVGGNDRITFFNRTADVETEVFSYAYNSDTVRFQGDVQILGNLVGNVTATGHLWGNRYAFAAHTTASDLSYSSWVGATANVITTNNGANFVVPFLQAADSGGVFNPSSGFERFTAPRDGLYFFTTNLTFFNGDGADDTMDVGFSVNSGGIVREHTINPRFETTNVVETSYSNSTVLDLNAGDTVHVVIVGWATFSGANQTQLTNRSFNGFYLGE